MSIQNLLNSFFRLSPLLFLAIACGVSHPVVAQQENPRLKYGWEAGKKYGYEFEVKYEIDGESEKATGFATYEVKGKNVAKDLSGDSLDLNVEGETTSTAFAVTPDGYLLTCAHCVQGAKVIEIVVNDQTLKARLIEADYDRDLAIIKIETTDLPTVSLGKSSKVELAQDVRAIGFPLSDVLGSSVKIAKGSVAGFVEEENNTTYQIDVAVNPGNSGGPLVNETGDVIGVVNAKLNGQRISKVGFSIPIKFACQMLERHKIRYTSEPATKVLTGPELARKLTPAVFFVKTEIGPGGHSHFSNLQLSVKGSIKRSGGSRRGRSEIVNGQAIIAADGHPMDSNDETALPMLLGPIYQMPFETLPNYATRRWSQVDSFVLPMPKSKPQQRRTRPGLDPFNPFGIPGRPGFGANPFGFGLGPRGFRGAEQSPQAPEMRMALGRQKSDYEIVKREGDLLTVKCKSELKTIGDKNEFSNLQISSNSTLTFDLKRGLFVSKKLDGKVKLKVGDEQIDIPLTLSYQQVDLESYLNSSAEAPDASGAETKTEPAVVGLSERKLQQFIDSQPSDYSPRELLAVLNKLASWNQDSGQKAAVVESITRVLNSEMPKNEQRAIKNLAMEALLNWDPAVATPFVIKAFEETSAFSKRSWIAKLGQTHHPDAASVLCQQLQNARLSAASKQALIQLGAAGEPAVIAKLRENGSQAAIAQMCLEVLSEIGTDSSLTAIEQLTEELPPAIKSTAQATTKKIQQRAKADQR